MQSEFAIIGMSCYLPGALDYQSFWHSLLGNNVSYQHAKTDTQPQYRPEKGLIEHAEFFDPARFNISEKEAEIMDPQTRKFIELVEQGLQDAGYPKASGLGKVGVIATQGTNHTYHNQLTKHLARGDISAVNQLMENINKGADFLATRAAYIFDLKGPCFNLQSACSSSLVAVVEAVHMLEAGRCDAVIVGGVHLSYPLTEGYMFESGSIYSGSGQCKPFDAKADGTIPSNGGGLIVIKPRAAAEAAGDRIHALITGVNSNNDGGQKVSYAAPSTKGQHQLLTEAYQQAPCNPTELEFIECHATGTVVGDPIEVRAIAQLMNTSPKAQQHAVLLGSVKGHIGHLFWSSGIASLIKSVLSLKYGIYPGTALLNTENPLLELGKTNLRVSNANAPLRDLPEVFAAVSSFGVGGTNAHLLVKRHGEKYLAAPPAQLSSYEARYPNAKKYSLIPDAETSQPHKGSASADERKPENAVAINGNMDEILLQLFEAALGEQGLNQDSNYFDHYGDSVTAVTLIADIKKTFGVELTQEDIFDQPTPALLSRLLKNKKPAQASQTSTTPITHAPVAEPFAFNIYQQRFYLLEKLQRGDYSNYNVSICFDIDDDFPKNHFTQTLQQLLSAIPGFSHKIQWRDGKPALGDLRTTIVAAEDLDISVQTDIKQTLDALFGRKFNLESGASCYVSFLHHGDCKYLVINTPHLLLDGKGLDNLLKAISDQAKGETQAGKLDERYIPRNIDTPIAPQNRDYWKALLRNTSATCLPYNMNATQNVSAAQNISAKQANCGRFSTTIANTQCQAIKRACEKWRTTSFALLYGFLNFHLYKVTGERKLCTGTTLLNRTEATRDMISCFVNNIPVVVEVQDGELFSFLDATRRALNEGIAHSQVPYDVIASDSNRSGQPLYKILFMLQNQNKGYELKLDAKRWYESTISYSPLYADLSINIVPQGSELYLDVTYDQGKYDHALISQFIEGYVANVSSCLSELEKEAYVG